MSNYGNKLRVLSGQRASQQEPHPFVPPDETFGEQGRVFISISGEDGEQAANPHSLIVTPDALLACWRVDKPLQHSGLIKLDHNGALKTDFGVDGVVKVTLNTRFPETKVYSAVPVEGDGIIAPGEFKVSGSQWNMAAIKLTDDGTVDTSFAEGGIFDPLTIPLHPFYQESDSCLRLAEGGIFFVGMSTDIDFEQQRYCFVRLLSDGKPDPGFGNNGVLLGDYRLETRLYIKGAILTTDEKIVTYGVLGTQGFIARHLLDGSLDTGFANGGLLSVSFPEVHSSHIIDIAETDDGRLLFSGGCRPIDEVDEAGHGLVGRITKDGAIDAGFNEGKPVVTRFFPERLSEEFKLAPQPDGKLVLLGHSHNPGINDSQISFLARLTQNGDLDTSFVSGAGYGVPENFYHNGLGTAVIVGANRIITSGWYSGNGAICAFKG